MKITTRIFAVSTMAALLISVNTNAFACENCMQGSAKTAAKVAKPAVKTVANAKVTAKTAKKNSAKTVVGAKTVAYTKAAAPACAHCLPAKK